MAYQGEQIKIVGLEAGGDLSASQYRFVKAGSTAKQVVQATVDGEKVLGVLQNKPSAAGRAAEIVMLGVTKVEAGEAISYGDAVKTDSAGRAAVIELTATGADVGDIAIGTALEAASDAGDVITVLIGVPQGRVFVS